MYKINCILLIDDDLAGNAFHSIIIHQSQTCHVVKTASNGIKALDYFSASKNSPENFPSPDLVFLDINMPKMNGFEFLDEYRKLSHTLPHLPVIVMLSTTSNPEDVRRVQEYREVAEFLNKPLTTDVIQQVIRKHFLED
jgi:CheY-like chemotaxis protein